MTIVKKKLKWTAGFLSDQMSNNQQEKDKHAIKKRGKIWENRWPEEPGLGTTVWSWVADFIESRWRSHLSNICQNQNDFLFQKRTIFTLAEFIVKVFIN